MGRATALPIPLIVGTQPGAVSRRAAAFRHGCGRGRSGDYEIRLETGLAWCIIWVLYREVLVVLIERNSPPIQEAVGT